MILTSDVKTEKVNRDFELPTFDSFRNVEGQVRELSKTGAVPRSFPLFLNRYMEYHSMLSV